MCHPPATASQTPRWRHRAPTALSLATVLLLAALLSWPAGPAAAGMLAKATCSCGYSRSLPLFGGRANFRRVCLVPGLCQSSGELIVYNILDPGARPKDCPAGRILPYAEPPLAPDNPQKTLTSWNVPGTPLRYVLYREGYFCPRCHRKTLHFSLAGFFD